jgi:hypothetical protein
MDQNDKQEADFTNAEKFPRLTNFRLNWFWISLHLLITNWARAYGPLCLLPVSPRS